MGKLLSFVIVIFLLGAVSAVCNDGQIDINTASLEELDNLSGIGPAYAQNIIDYRKINTFNSVDELIEVNGIGEKTLLKIKSQGLACVSIEEEPITPPAEEEENQGEADIEEYNESPLVVTQISNNENKESNKPITAGTIYLNKQSKDIKTSENLLKLENIAVYGLFGFCILLGILFAVKKIKNPKTEFK